MENVDYLGGLKIENSQQITSLQGLEKVIKIGKEGILWKKFDCSVSSFEGLNNLTEIEGILSIHSQDFKSFKGLEKVTYVGGLSVSGELGYDMPLKSFEGLNNLTRVGGEFYCFYCEFESLDGLNKLEYVSGDFAIASMSKLTDISALSNLKYVKFSITINYDPMLYDFTPLKNVLTNFTGELYISNNGYNPTKEQILNGQGKPQ